MKRFFSCCMLTVMLILSVATISTGVCINDQTIREYNQADLNDETSVLSKKDYLFIEPDAPVTPVALNNVSNAGIPATAATTWSNPYHMLKACFSLLTNRQLYTTKSAYISLYAQKVKNGYYIYALRKLLI